MENFQVGDIVSSENEEARVEKILPNGMVRIVFDKEPKGHPWMYTGTEIYWWVNKKHLLKLR